MSAFLEVVLIKAALAALLAVVIRAVAPLVRRPALSHALWLLVLLELLSPPVLRLGLLPIAPAVETTAAAPTFAGSAIPGVAAGGSHGLASLALGLWLVGSGVVLALAVVRILRFRRLVSTARDAPAPLVAQALELSRSMGLARCPRVRLVPGRLSPMLWGLPGAVEILLPEALLQDLGEAERDALIAHELAHFRRRDHWVRLVELAAQCAFWWHPAVWWARAHLRRLEEVCCDALVIATLPGKARDYARSLVRTMEFLASAPRTPLLASGFTGSPRWKERLTMILENSVPGSPSRWQKISLAAVGASLLLVLPTWAEREVAGDPRPVEECEVAPNIANEEMHQRLSDLDREARELMARLELVQVERARVAASLPGSDLPGEMAHDLDAMRRTIEAVAELRSQRAEELAQMERSMAGVAEARVRGELAMARDLQRKAIEQQVRSGVDSEVAAARMALERDAARVELEQRQDELRTLQLELEKLRAERESER